MMKRAVDLRVKVSLLSIAAVFITVSLVSCILARIDKTVYPDTISLAGVSLAGIDRDEARYFLAKKVQKACGDSILLKLPDQTVAIPFKDLGISYDYNASLRKADNYLEADGIWGLFRHSIVRGKKHNIAPVFHVQEEVLSKGLQEFKASYDKAPLDARIKYNNGKLDYLLHQNGYSINTLAVQEKIIEALHKGSVGPVNATVQSIAPRIKMKDITLISDLLGVKACLLNSADGNLDKLLLNIDGTILMPGESFKLTDTTGKSADMDMYNLTLVQNLLLKTGEEAGLTGDGSGCFINKLKHPVMLSFKIEEQTLVARIFGFQSVPNKKVIYETEEVDIPPGLCVVVDEELEPGEKKIKHPGTNGKIKRNYEIITIKGKIVSKELLSEHTIPPQDTLVFIAPGQK